MFSGGTLNITFCGLRGYTNSLGYSDQILDFNHAPWRRAVGLLCTKLKIVHGGADVAFRANMTPHSLEQCLTQET